MLQPTIINCYRLNQHEEALSKWILFNTHPLSFITTFIKRNYCKYLEVHSCTLF